MKLSLTQFSTLNLVENREHIVLLASVEDANKYLVGWDCETDDNNLESIIENTYTNSMYPFKVFVTVRPMTDFEIKNNRMKIRDILSQFK